MTEDRKFTESEAQRHFAVQFNNLTWELLDKPLRTPDENERLLDYAHASLAHWRAVGTVVHHQRGEWMLARVHAVLGDGTHALKHATRCFELTEAHKNEMKDFDLAFAYEALARAYAVSGDKMEARKWIDFTTKAGEVIADADDREIFLTEFRGGDWYGVEL